MGSITEGAKQVQLTPMHFECSAPIPVGHLGTSCSGREIIKLACVGLCIKELEQTPWGGISEILSSPQSPQKIKCFSMLWK